MVKRKIRIIIASVVEVINKNPREWTIKNLKTLRDGFSDEIPDRIISSTDRINKYKVRAGWFQSVVSCLDLAELHGCVSDPVALEKVEDFRKWVIGDYKDRILKGGLTLREDIDKANGILNFLLSSLRESS